MKLIYNLFVVAIVGSIIVYLVAGISMVNVVRNTAAEAEISENSIGKQIAIDNDTLTITDYSVFTKTYTLSSGIKIHEKMVNENTLVND